MRRLELILKLTERCNIACSYCYYFENAERSALDRPPLLNSEVLAWVTYRIKEALDSSAFDNVRVVFHGGEPMLIGKRRFAEVCKALDVLTDDGVSLCIQTNAMFVDQEWIDLFSHYRVA